MPAECSQQHNVNMKYSSGPRRARSAVAAESGRNRKSYDCFSKRTEKRVKVMQRIRMPYIRTSGKVSYYFSME